MLYKHTYISTLFFSHPVFYWYNLDQHFSQKKNFAQHLNGARLASGHPCQLLRQPTHPSAPATSWCVARVHTPMPAALAHPSTCACYFLLCVWTSRHPCQLLCLPTLPCAPITSCSVILTSEHLFHLLQQLSWLCAPPTSCSIARTAGHPCCCASPPHPHAPTTSCYVARMSKHLCHLLRHPTRPRAPACSIARTFYPDTRASCCASPPTHVHASYHAHLYQTIYHREYTPRWTIVTACDS